MLVIVREVKPMNQTARPTRAISTRIAAKQPHPRQQPSIPSSRFSHGRLACILRVDFFVLCCCCCVTSGAVTCQASTGWGKSSASLPAEEGDSFFEDDDDDEEMCQMGATLLIFCKVISLCWLAGNLCLEHSIDRKRVFF